MHECQRSWCERVVTENIAYKYGCRLNHEFIVSKPVLRGDCEADPMIDIHCHVLPGMDDGPASMDESLAMVRLAVADRLKAHVKDHLAPFKYPRWITFVDELPKTATGKIQRFQLRND